MFKLEWSIIVSFSQIMQTFHLELMIRLWVAMTNTNMNVLSQFVGLFCNFLFLMQATYHADSTIVLILQFKICTTKLAEKTTTKT